MRVILYCKKCGYMGEGKSGGLWGCPDCGTRLQDTGISRELWLMMPDQERQAALAQWAGDPDPAPACSKQAPAAPEQNTPPRQTRSFREPVAEGAHPVATILKVIAIIELILGGLAWTILVWNEAGIAFLLLLACGVSSVFLFGFAAVIRLLQKSVELQEALLRQASQKT